MGIKPTGVWVTADKLQDLHKLGYEELGGSLGDGLHMIYVFLSDLKILQLGELSFQTERAPLVVRNLDLLPQLSLLFQTGLYEAIIEIVHSELNQGQEDDQ